MAEAPRSLDDDECERLTRVFEQLQMQGERTVAVVEFDKLSRHMLSDGDPGDLAARSPPGPQQLQLREWLERCGAFSALGAEAFDGRLASFRARLAQNSGGMRRRVSVAKMQPLSSFRKAPLRAGQTTRSFQVPPGARSNGGDGGGAGSARAAALEAAAEAATAATAAAAAAAAGSSRRISNNSKSFHSFGAAERAGAADKQQQQQQQQMQIRITDSDGADLGTDLGQLSRRGSAATVENALGQLSRKCSFHLNSTRNLLELQQQAEAEEDCGMDVAELIEGLDQLQLAGEEPKPRTKAKRRASAKKNVLPKQASARTQKQPEEVAKKKTSSFCVIA